MPKTKEELNQLKNEYESLTSKLKELTEDELEAVCGGENIWDIAVKLKDKFNISSDVNAHGKNGKPTLPLWDEASSGLITNPVIGRSSPEEHNIMITGDFTGNYANGAGGGVTNEGKL